MDNVLFITELIERARKAQKEIEFYTQEQVLNIAKAMAWTTVHHAEEWAKLNYEETGMGDIASKIARINNRPRGVLRDLLNAKTVGVVEVDEAKGLVKIAKPVGVIGALVPVTVPVGVVVIKGMNSIMGRNAIIFSPHPAARNTTVNVVNKLREVAREMGVPEDLFIVIEEPTKDISAELMKQCDLVIATGGQPMVKAAYSSGTPAYGVGAGNVVSVIDGTTDLDKVAGMICESQLNDLSSGCSTENSIVILDEAYDKMMAAFKRAGGYLCNAEEKKKLQDALWTFPGHLNSNVIMRPAKTIADIASFKIPNGTNFIMVEETGAGPDFPFSNEKLSVVLAIYRTKTFGDAIKMVNLIQSFKGAGHSCGIHSSNEDRIMEVAMRTYTARVAVNQPQNKSNAGSFNNGMPFTISLGCGTWGGNITCENITWKHYINYTWVARPIQGYEPTNKELFGNIMNMKVL